jgi:hypothetical protein
MPTSDFRDRVRAELLEFAWSQWTQMGLSGTATRRDRWAVDPEALLLFTLRLARRDPRLFDETLDWIRENGRLISVQRLRNLATGDQMSRRLADVALAWAGSHNPELHGWASRGPIMVEGPPEALFLPDGGLFAGESDPQFLAHGFVRPRAEPSFKSRPPDPTTPINFGLRLRLLFGIGTRAEVARFLLTTDHPEVSAQQVAEATAFAKRNIGDSLTTFAEAGVVDARWRGNERVFWIDRRRWTAMLGMGLRDLPDFVDWIRLLRALLAISVWLDDDAEMERSDYLRASGARELIDRIRPDLLAAGVEVRNDSEAHGADYWRVFEATVDATLRMARAS